MYWVSDLGEMLRNYWNLFYEYPGEAYESEDERLGIK